jgi:hypothetical protein
MHTSLKIIKTLLCSYSALHVSGTLAPIIRSLLILHKQPPVTVCRWVGCVFQLWSVTTVAKAWGGVVVSSLGIFLGASESSMCPGVDSASKHGYQDIPGGKDGRCVRVTTLPPSCAECLEILEP